MKQLLVLLLILPSVAYGQTWLVTDNPNEIYTYLEVNKDCPGELTEYEEIVEGVLVRSRLKTEIGRITFAQVHDPETNEPTGEWITHRMVGDAKPFLNIVLSCGKEWKDTMHLFKIDARFAYIGSYPPITLLFDYPRSIPFGAENLEVIKSNLKQSVEVLITRYLKANFDLGEDDD